MRTRSSSNLPVESPPNPSTSNTKRRNRRHSKQPFILEESLVDTMADQRTMVELLRAPTEGYAEPIVVPSILSEQFELKHSLINMMTSDQFFGLEKDNPHDHIRWFNKITSTIKYNDVPNSGIKLMLYPFSLAGAARRTTNLRNEIANFQQRFDESFHEAWDRYKDLLRACPYHGFTELQQLNTFYNALNPADQDSLNSAVGGNLLERRTQDVLTIIKNKSKIHNSRNKLVVSQVKSSDANSDSSSEIAKLTHAVNQQTSDVTTAMTAILKQFQATPPPGFVKAVKEIFVTCGGAHPYYQCLAAGGNTFLELRDNIQGYITAAEVNYNQGASINLMPLSVWKKLDLPELISTRMTFELANRAICTPVGIARDVFVSIGKFTFPADFVIVDYESDPRVPLIFGRPFLRTALALIDVHGEEMILHDGDERLTLNMRHDTSSYSNQHQKESINIINIYDDSKIEYLLHHDPIKDMDSSLKDPIDQSNLDDLNGNLVDTMHEMFIDEHALDYSSPSLYDEYDDDISEVESDTKYVYDDPFDSKGEKIKGPKLLIYELDLPSDFIPSSEYDSFLSEDFSKVDDFPSTNNEDKNAKKLAISHAFSILEDFDHPLYELPFFKEVPRSKTLLSFSSENKEKAFKPGILTSKEVHSSLIPELSHQGYKVFKIIKILKSLMDIFLFSRGKDIHNLDVPCLYFYPP
uniref:Reverse transcriptase domain-containing protein n=1 Tax=Tanacetum cinerariifolium TaxID=118510 RepID=A0A6L2KMB6_TANCI|nr:reverse transcriptase domain-containing protein [Tanacetum cinerariifolium]